MSKIEELKAAMEVATKDKTDLFDFYDEHFDRLLAIAEAAERAMKNGADTRMGHADDWEIFAMEPEDAKAIRSALSALNESEAK